MRPLAALALLFLFLLAPSAQAADRPSTAEWEAVHVVPADDDAVAHEAARLHWMGVYRRSRAASRVGLAVTAVGLALGAAFTAALFSLSPDRPHILHLAALGGGYLIAGAIALPGAILMNASVARNRRAVATLTGSSVQGALGVIAWLSLATTMFVGPLSALPALAFASLQLGVNRGALRRTEEAGLQAALVVGPSWVGVSGSF